MNSAQLIGRVAAEYLHERLSADERGDDADGTARFILDCLSAEHTASIAKAILDEPQLKDRVEVKLPEYFMAGYSLPDSVLTDKPATHFRNSPCDRPALLVANTGFNEEQSIKEIVPIGAPQLQDHPEIWVRVASQGLGFTSEQCKWWEKALTGVRDLHKWSLERLAEYVIRTRLAIKEDGQPFIVAVGAALPALKIPKDSAYFNSLNERVRGHASRWKRLYDSVDKKRACFLEKQTPMQFPLTEDDLRATFDKVKDSIPEAVHEVVLSFISAPSGWNKAAGELAECEWESIAPLFDGFKRVQFNLGQETINFYDERDPDLLNADEGDYLERLIKRKTTSSEEEDRNFYESHRNELKEDRKLKSAWDRFVFGKPMETGDFLSGVTLCLEHLFSQDTPSASRKLRIRCERTNKKELRDFNVDAGLFFARRYKGLKALFGRKVAWEVGSLFDFPELVENWRSTGKKLTVSTARSALHLKFLLELEVTLGTGGSEKYSTQMIWKFNPETVSSEFVEDWSRLMDHPMVSCVADRESLSAKGQFQTVDLSNVKTFVPVFGKDRGSFVAVYKPANNIARIWSENLGKARTQGLVSDEIARDLKEQFEVFKETYSESIEGFTEDGVAHPALIEQLKAYSNILSCLCLDAKGDRNRDLLLRPLLQLGTVAVEGGRPTAIVTPWHPLRMAAMAVKARLVADLIKRLLTTKQIDFGDPRLFFKDMEEELAHPFYPELVLGWQENKPELLSLTDVVGDYSLHELPVVSNDGLDDTNENPAEAANRVVDLVQRYLALHPHEQANLSIVLYNCDSARLPQAVVDKIGTLHDLEDEIRCQVILRHRDGKRLRNLYEKIIEASDGDADSFNASEATRDFMARLRIGIMADQAPAPSNKDGLPTDIVFSQDVIARHAHVEWYPENSKPVDLNNLIPARWSRRRPAAMDDMKSVVYLCCPVQSAEGWVYLTALTTFLKGDWDGNETKRLLPARQLDFRDNITARIFEETHNLGNWVVNYDELLDRRQLLNQNVRVIRYKQSATQGRNLVISSKAPLGLLQSMVLSRIKALNLELDEASYKDLAGRFINDAKDISGDIVLRAAKRGRNASELMGIVLSRFLVHHELGRNRYFGWYFLDDYASWLGQREEQIADILALSPEITQDGKLRLAVVITEAKYIDASSLAAKRKESQKQLRDTVKRINDALFGNPERLDRDLWLARLSDLVLDGIKFPASANISLTDWRRAIREGECEIFVRGYSHVFVSGPSGDGDYSDFVQVAELEDSYQEVFGRAQVRELVMKYHLDQDPMQIREEGAGSEPWKKQIYRQPSDHIKPNIVIKTSEVDVKKEPLIAETAVSTQEFGKEADQSTGEVEASGISPSGSSAPEAIDSKWAYPQIASLLDTNDAQTTDSAEDQAWLKQVESQTKGALQQFQLRSKLLSSILTPNSALLKFEGSANLTVDQVMKRRSEFLTTHGLNIIFVRPEPGVISLSIERPHRKIVQLQDVWQHWHPDSTNGNQELPIAIREDDGNLLFLSPGKHHAPHTLIAGSTGSGKSVLMQNIILGITATNTPSQARITLIDPKQGVDYFQFDGLPHLEEGVIDEQERALQKLHQLVAEMDSRYAKFKSARVNNLDSFNRKMVEADRLPMIWVIHDEFAEWMMVEDYKEEVTALVGRLGVKARAAGIYLVFAAQRPDSNVMPMQLRANLGNRLILRVDSEGTSEIALGERGAERLLGRGHILAKLEGSPLCYAQVPFIEEEFMIRLVEEIKQS
jgi:S-DNA-T family DNA segregation ATPase FtsK/SpoIIIE